MFLHYKFYQQNLYITKMPMDNHRHLLFNKKRLFNYASALAVTETTLLF